MLVERLQDSNLEISRIALNNLIDEVKSATTSVTSVPKSLKFLKTHFLTIKNAFDNVPDSDFKVYLPSNIPIFIVFFNRKLSQISFPFYL